MKKIRYGIIGCGEHALRAHAVPGLEVPELELVALCDPSEPQMAAFGAALGGRAECAHYTDEVAFLTHAEIDAVVISSPDRYHSRSLLDAILCGKHVLCEKPLADDASGLDDVKRALEFARESGLVVTSCHPRRLDPPFLWLRENLVPLARRFKGLCRIEFDFSYHRPSGAKGDLHVGLLMDHLNHEHDLMNYLLGPSPVHAQKISDGTLAYRVIGVRDDGVEFEFGGTRFLESSRYPEFFRARFHRGAMELDCETGEIRIHDHETGKVETPRTKGTDYALRFTAVMANFAAAIRGTEPNYLTDADLVGNTEIGIALTAATTWRSPA